MMKTLFIATRVIAFWTIVLGGVYPLIITGLGQWWFPYQANGSIDQTVAGAHSSDLIAQSTSSPKFFHPRPSAVDYATMPSGASNLSLASKDLVKAVETRKQEYAQMNGVSVDQVPSDAVFTSASGIDPHISRENAFLQANRVARENGISLEFIQSIVEKNVESKSIIGTEVVNVNKLNRAVILSL